MYWYMYICMYVLMCVSVGVCVWLRVFLFFFISIRFWRNSNTHFDIYDFVLFSYFIFTWYFLFPSDPTLCTILTISSGIVFFVIWLFRLINISLRKATVTPRVSFLIVQATMLNPDGCGP